MAAQETIQTEIQHEPTLYAEPVFKVGSFIVTNSYLNSLITVVVLVLFFVAVRRKISKIPRGIQNFFELILEGTLSFADSVTADRKKSEKFLPLVLSLFLFILVNNWLGLLPGIGTIGFVEYLEGHKVFVPFFRGGTADLNLTLALAMTSLLIVQLFGVIGVGAWNYLNKFINFKTLLDIPKNIRKDVMVLVINPIQFFVGIIEMISEFSKVISLSLRLFGNIFAGEVVLVVFLSLASFIVPIPFYFLEVLVGVLQAFIFSMLVLIYLTMATAAEH